MKKIIFSIALMSGVFSVSSQVQAPLMDSLPFIKVGDQPKFLVNFHTGYAVGLGSTFKFYPDDITSISVEQLQGNPETRSIRYKEQSQGLGEGIRFGAGISYILNDFVNIGLDIDYFRSTISKTKDSAYHRTLSIGGSIDELQYNDKYKISYQTTLVTFSPNITFKAISKPKFFIYNKIGAIVIFRPNSIQTETREGRYRMGWQGFFRDSSALNEKRFEWGIKNPALGFMGGIGAQRKVTEKLRVYAELQFTHVVFKVRNRMLTNFKVDGVETINSLPLSQREVVFRDNVTSEELTGNPDRPSIAIYQRFPVTYLGLQAGIALRF